ncbi:MAG: HupV protein [Gammaproteobacteria bacterium]|jgi:hydrogenase large subunit|nr:HupV protein [Gammaproteobacteria bacterium]MBT3725920.1 HupV protein [Gammaproteobacteria bacterium]MBT4076140.1 HupV protein [Gammaproteobacteria bacterium]MBT4195859.1 HupV protein [Gammaproteobacteria bacterium]MBT4448967.1 HupV protein [Gammaproteobacteria bacterium]
MASNSSSRRILGPFNRVEGDLEVNIEVDQQKITQAWVNAPLFRGYEQILHGKDPRDSLIYTPRICGICSISQSVAAAQAIASAQGLKPAQNGQLATNLILAAENMADHLTHFYLFFMPDFARDCYKDKTWFNDIAFRFKAQTGSSARDVLPARAAFLHLTGILAGKWPHSLALQPGGTTRPVESQERIRLLSTITAFRHFLQDVLFGAELEQVAALSSEEDLLQFVDQHNQYDFARFISIAQDLNLNHQGKASDNFMSYGAYPEDEHFLFNAGTWQQHLQTFNPEDIREDISHSWVNSKATAKHPFQGSTIPDSDETSGYSWCKAPRLNQQVMEVGAISRQVISGHPLIRDLVSKTGANVQNRVISRLLELALVVPAMENWVKQIQPGQSFCHESIIPQEAQGAGLVEAARGSLGHWLRVKNGRILNYQIIAPTTWNFSPRDSSEQPGALELALQGTEMDDDKTSAAMIQHIIRSFDPCMVCTVH